MTISAKQDLFAIIMAGGKGERFWPQSRVSNPKPLLRLVGDLSLVEQTVERVRRILPPENILVVTNGDYVPSMRSLLPFIPSANVIGEPIGRDTAPCVALALAVVKKMASVPNPAIIFLPADHMIGDSDYFASLLDDCSNLSLKNRIVTIGVAPRHPSPGYGYIVCGQAIQTPLKTKFHEVKSFREKPDSDTAKNLLELGNCRWNSGIFVGTFNSIFDAFKKHSPCLQKAVDSFGVAIGENRLEECLAKTYPELEKISFDCAILEKCSGMIAADYDSEWDDVGSWTALRRQISATDSSGNVVRGTHFGLGTKDCVIVGDSKRLIATIDTQDIVIVNTEDATLVCSAKSAQRIKELVLLLGKDPELSKFL